MMNFLFDFLKIFYLKMYKSNKHVSFILRKFVYISLIVVTFLFKNKFNNIFVNSRISKESLVFKIEFLISDQFNKSVGYSPWVRLFNN